MVQMHVADHHILDVIRLQANFGELHVDGVFGRHFGREHTGELAPVGAVGDEFVVVTGVKQHIALGVLDHEEANGDLNFRVHGREILQEAFAEHHRARAKGVELHAGR